MQFQQGLQLLDHANAVTALSVYAVYVRRVIFRACQRGEQALSVKVLETPPSLSKAQRKSPETMAVIVEDLIKMLDQIGNGYRHGRHPDSGHAAKTAKVLRAVADELEL